MFYCELCRRDNAWPESLFRSHGRCEVCGSTDTCYDVSSSTLPPSKPPTSRVQKLRRVDEAKREILKLADRQDVAMHRAISEYHRAIHAVVTEGIATKIAALLGMQYDPHRPPQGDEDAPAPDPSGEA